MGRVLRICSRFTCAMCQKQILCLLEGEWAEDAEKLYGIPLFGTLADRDAAGWRCLRDWYPPIWLCPDHATVDEAGAAAIVAAQPPALYCASLEDRLKALLRERSGMDRDFSDNDIVGVVERALSELAPEARALFWKHALGL